MKLLECDQLLLSTLSDSDIDELARVLRALAHPVRLKLVNTIATSVQAGILQREQRGKWAWFQVDSDHLAEICAVIC